MQHDLNWGLTSKQLRTSTANARSAVNEGLAGKVVGGVTYIGHTEDDLARIEARIEARIKAGIPLPHEDDETLESNLLFASLSDAEKAQVRAATDPLEKRRLIAAGVIALVDGRHGA